MRLSYQHDPQSANGHRRCENLPNSEVQRRQPADLHGERGGRDLLRLRQERQRGAQDAEQQDVRQADAQLQMMLDAARISLRLKLGKDSFRQLTR